ncbi:MAG: type IV pilus biogenesis protein PilM, partial [Pirellulales bacterium]
MAFVAIQIQDEQILVAAARVSQRSVTVSHMFSIELAGDSELAAEALKSSLAKHGLSRSDAAVIVSRADAEIRELTIPPAPDNEIPDMVRFVANNEFVSLSDLWALDYVPLRGDSTQSRDVLAVCISPELQQRVMAITGAAGLKVKHILLRPFATVELLGGELSDGECRLIIDPNGDQTDMTVVDGDLILTTRTIRLAASSEGTSTLLSEARRTLASAKQALGDRKVSEVLMFGESEHYVNLAAEIQTQLELGVRLVMPSQLAPLDRGCDLPEFPERFAAVVGALKKQSTNGKHVLDFVNPRKPIVVKRDHSRWYQFGGVAAAVFIVAIASGWWALRQQASEIDALQTELSRLTRLNDGVGDNPSVEQIRGEVAKIDEWKIADVNWLEELSEYSARSLTPDDTIVDAFDAVTGLKAGGNARIVVNMRTTAVGKEAELIKELSEARFTVKPTRGAVDPTDKNYPLATSLRVEFTPDRDQLLVDFNNKATEYRESSMPNSSQASEDVKEDVKED